MTPNLWDEIDNAVAILDGVGYQIAAERLREAAATHCAAVRKVVAAMEASVANLDAFKEPR